METPSNYVATNCGGEIFPFFDLPEEIRAMIYQKTDAAGLLNMRAGSKQLKKEIDNYASFTIRIDDVNYKQHRSLFKLRAESCVIENWTRCGRSANLPAVVYPHSRRLKKLVFNGPCKKRIIAYLFRKCPQIETLVCTHELMGACPNAFQSKQIQKKLSNLHNLKMLKLQLLRPPVEEYDTDMKSNILLFLQSTFPRLESFTLDFALCGEWDNLLKFLIRHSKGLRQLNLHVGDLADRTITQSNMNQVSVEGIEQLYNNLQLSHFTFRDNILHLNPAVKAIILELLIRQCNCLETFEFGTSRGDISFDIFLSIVRNNELKLTDVTVQGLRNIVPDDGINFYELPFLCLDLFADCRNLRKLSLTASSKQETDLFPHYPTIMTLSYLPKSLISLELTDYQLCEENYISDILEFTKSCPNLESFVLSSPYDMPVPKIKYSYLLKTIIENCKMLKYVNVNPVFYSRESDDSNNSELLELVELFHVHMNVGFDPNDDLEGFEVKF